MYHTHIHIHVCNQKNNHIGVWWLHKTLVLLPSAKRYDEGV